VTTWEVAIVTGGPDDSWENRDETVTEDVGLPDHERDETRRQPGESGDDDPAEVAAMADSGLTDSGLPDHEDDSARGGDTGGAEQNP
jgi:hypothetical protein